MVSSAMNKAKKMDNDLRNLEYIVNLLEKLHGIIEEVNKIGKDIFCLIEIKKKDSGFNARLFYAWLGVEKSEKTRAGVNVLTWKDLVKDIQDIQYVIEIIILKTLLNSTNNKYSFIYNSIFYSIIMSIILH